MKAVLIVLLILLLLGVGFFIFKRVRQENDSQIPSSQSGAARDTGATSGSVRGELTDNLSQREVRDSNGQRLHLSRNGLIMPSVKAREDDVAIIK